MGSRASRFAIGRETSPDGLEEAFANANPGSAHALLPYYVRNRVGQIVNVKTER